MEDRARELYDFLCQLAAARSLPRVSKDGGVVLVGWSFGGAWITALLAHLETFEKKDGFLGKYIRKFILLGTYQVSVVISYRLFLVVPCRFYLTH